MAKKHFSFDYETLVRFMLPQGMLDYFEIIKIDEEVTDEKDETGTVIRILHIYLATSATRYGMTSSLMASRSRACSTTFRSVSTRCFCMCAAADGWTRTDVTSFLKACLLWQTAPATLWSLRTS